MPRTSIYQRKRAATSSTASFVCCMRACRLSVEPRPSQICGYSLSREVASLRRERVRSDECHIRQAADCRQLQYNFYYVRECSSKLASLLARLTIARVATHKEREASASKANARRVSLIEENARAEQRPTIASLDFGLTLLKFSRITNDTSHSICFVYIP